jgi:hypothetical protein
VVRKESFAGPGCSSGSRAAASVTLGVSALPRGAKTLLQRSSVSVAGLAQRVAWLPLGRDERDPQQFWLLVLGALSQTAPGVGGGEAVDGGPGAGQVGDH